VSQAQPEHDSLERLARELERLERITTQWATEQRATVEAIRTTTDAIQKEALRRLVRTLKDDEQARPALLRAAQDEWVRALLSYHGILRAPAPEKPLAERLQAALATVRPALEQHAGNVELVGLDQDHVTLRLVGSCDGCAFAGTGTKEQIEAEIKRVCPEIERVTFSNGAAFSGDKLVELRPTRKAHDVCAASEVPANGALFRDVQGVSLLLTRQGETVRAYPNACPHLGMPLDDAALLDGVISCRYHGFKFVLASGECLTAPEVALQPLPVQVRDGRVHVDLGRSALRVTG
jgi:nitrite reductase/ring-hydroxylating ferredoxin subunit/Fe-S cluster biogenesis protein NfuA